MLTLIGRARNCADAADICIFSWKPFQGLDAYGGPTNGLSQSEIDCRFLVL